MSAFLVDDKTINRIVTGLMTAHPRHDHQLEVIRKELGATIGELYFHDGFDGKLSGAMLCLNVDALKARYPSDYEEMLSPSEGYKWEPASVFQLLKSLNCWLYQCAEADIPETSRLYATFKQYEHFLERDIVYSLPEYDQAEWG